MTTALGIDIGGSASRWVIVEKDGEIIARGTAPGASGHLFNPTERQRLEATLAAIANATRAHGPSAAFLGITGLGAAVHGETRAMVEAVFGIAPSHTGLSDDLELAFNATFAPGAGHLVSAGTGSMGLHITASGETVRVGGRGLLIDDGGSGTWIALTALDQIYRRIDETGGPADATILAAELFTDIGGDDWANTRGFIYGGDRGRIGTLAQAVARAADRGDALATDILRQAASEIARLGTALMARAGVLPVAVIGGVVTLHPLIAPAIAAELTGTTVSFPRIDAALTAAKAARDRL